MYVVNLFVALVVVTVLVTWIIVRVARLLTDWYVRRR